ncbi:ABC transporter permease [Paenibacillus nasutitermitis]|uniref:Sugar ABC transporter permease n=1 Tax=Paenibacillus nasutitermitis TaxID=1652958 RepID=A0A917E2N4_9BACL|nr:ABC transporter permease subunit [Paenibacillus nasutitermitis]GGD99101.1 sugar ABC transporter permease [Paenibacillus nasutitermitis]
MKKRQFRFSKGDRELTLLALPSILYIFVFSYLTMFGVIIAFKNYRYDKGMLGSEWVGLSNFKFFFISDKAFIVTRNTIMYSLWFWIITTLSALLVAILLNEISRKWSKYYQTIMFLPTFVSWVVVMFLAQMFLNHNYGFLNRFFEAIGMERILWYLEPTYWPLILTFAHLWKAIGFSALVYYAGIVAIDPSYYEAARMDGATRFQMARKITIPMLSPLIIILMIMAIGNMFRGDFGLHFFVSNNAPLLYNTTDIIDTFVYRALSVSGDISMATAVGFYQSFVGLLLVVGANYTVRKISEENSLW